MIGMTTSVGARPHRVTFQNPGPAVPNDDGGFSQSWIDLAPPALSVSIEPATAADLERLAAGTVVSQATHIVRGPYHPQVTTKTRILFNGRVFSVKGASDPEERHVEGVWLCTEVVA
jgi:SPP1 family predicted phage head-tail adaptor